MIVGYIERLPMRQHFRVSMGGSSVFRPVGSAPFSDVGGHVLRLGLQCHVAWRREFGAERGAKGRMVWFMLL